MRKYTKEQLRAIEEITGDPPEVDDDGNIYVADNYFRVLTDVFGNICIFGYCAEDCYIIDDEENIYKMKKSHKKIKF